MSSSRANLGAASEDRKARLAKLRSLKRKQPEDEVEPAEASRASPSLPDGDIAKLHLSGRNYDPETRGAKLGFEAPPTLNWKGPTLEEQAAVVEQGVRQEAAEEATDERGIDLFKLQPKKPNWDLKRELNRKLEVLNVRTDNAIARLVRERLAAKKATTAGKPDSVAAATDGGDLEGAALVEGIRMREKEDEDEARREREEDDLA